MANVDPEVLSAAIEAVTEKYDADILVYVGMLIEPDDDRVLNACRRRSRRRKNVLLVLSTPGGSADAAYRIARCLQRSYKTKSDTPEERGTLYIYVHDMCKSAGTLLALGATTLIMSQRAELGPIDVQLLNEEEVGERRSGLAPRKALETLSTEAGKTFYRMFRMMRHGGLQLPTRIAADSAATLAIGLMEPIYAQLDPIRMGEIERSVNIAQDYGDRLRTSNVKPNTIEKLLTDYPSHEFVIDRDEARDLFERVEIPSDELELVAGTFIRLHHPTPENMDGFVRFINRQIEAPTETDDEAQAGDGDGATATADANGKRSAASRNPRGAKPRPAANGSGDVAKGNDVSGSG